MRRRWWILLVCSICLALVVPLAVSAQDEPEPVPFTQIVTEDGLITLAYPEAWSILQDAPLADGIAFASDPELIATLDTEEAWNASDAAIVTISLITKAQAAELGFQGDTVAINAGILRDLLASATELNGQPTNIMGDMQTAPGPGADSEIYHFTAQEQGLFSVYLMWEPVDGLMAWANVYTPEANWETLQPVVLDMLRSVEYLGDPAQLQAEGGN